MGVALVHDYLTQLGGGEKVLSAFCEMFPEAPIYTLIYDEKATAGVFKSRKIHNSFLQKVPGSKKHFRYLIPLMPLAVEQFDLSDFELVISVSHSYGKGVITKPGTKHICYCLTPTRYLWHDAGLPFKPISSFLLTYLRAWDYQAAQRPDYFIADSENVRQRIKKYYNRESVVIYPPVETENYESRIANQEPKFINSKFLIPNSYFLTVGRLVPYKRFEVAIQAFSELRIKNYELRIIGDGPERKKLEKLAKRLGANNVKFLGNVYEKELQKYYADCKALIFPQEEDFGIALVEVMASGRPVIAYRSGGALETVIEGETGYFFEEQTPESLAEAVKNFNEKKFNPERIRRHAEKFDKKVFKDKVSEFISKLT